MNNLLIVIIVLYGVGVLLSLICSFVGVWAIASYMRDLCELMKKEIRIMEDIE